MRRRSAPRSAAQLELRPEFLARPGRRAVVLGGLLGGVVTGALAGCSGNSSGETGGKTVLTIGDEPTPDQAANLKIYRDNVASFQAAHPDVVLKTEQTTWDAQTFQTKLAGGTLPDVLSVPFTEGRSLAQAGQVADLGDVLESTGLAAKLNPQTLRIGQASDGRTFGVPVAAYSMGLALNRALFRQAGLDPDRPPATWDEVRAAAAQITQRTGVPGFGQMTSDNTGGWVLTAQTYSRGGSVVDEDGGRTTLAGPTRDALDLLHRMRFTDGSIGANALYDHPGAAEAFAAGKFAMYVIAPDVYTAIVVNSGFPAQDFGSGPLPQGGATPAGTLAGGTLQVVSPRADDARRKAAVQWIEWLYLRQYTSQEQAVDTAQAAADSGGAVGLPGLSVLSDESYAQYQRWIEPYVNVPVANFTAYAQALPTIPILPEPAKNAQAVYAALDPVVQSVLTRSDADPAALLKAAGTTIDAQLAR
ncbi:ABC transporter substrate-binding protein [Kineococcus rhizosphaerae]|uniref:Carbohydrate ABC transporter substrate-binding protein (CUT1 family) n=1 Tax=Kineococcus rhizosphaerae TaxID=559628 RepID=A0A2T0R8Q7_9ACTN|nr:extracellular solute-binding protein [Kineococcus rhizosphaerae]PRY17563.1 carbohydrate ABC transporter substrate-binding protein (CUT1 family) [Kineococcus rhizosphaerae]